MAGAFCEEICVKRNFTVPHKPDQNPYAERGANVTQECPLGLSYRPLAAGKSAVLSRERSHSLSRISKCL